MNHPPEIEDNAIIKTWHENTSELELTCVVHSCPPPRVSWYLDGHLLEERHHVISSFGENFTLLLSNITTEKTMGTIECRAENNLGTASASSESDGSDLVSQTSTTRLEVAEEYGENVANYEEYPLLQTSVYDIDIDDITNITTDDNYNQTYEKSDKEMESNSTFVLKDVKNHTENSSIKIVPEENQGNIVNTSLSFGNENDDLSDEEESVKPFIDIYDIYGENMNSSLSFDIPEDFSNESSLHEDIERLELAGNARVLSSLDSEHDTRYRLEWLVISPSEVLESTVKFREENGEENDWYFITAKLRKDGPDVFLGSVVLEHLEAGTEYRVHIASKNQHDYNSFSDSFFFTTKHIGKTDADNNNFLEEDLIEEGNVTMENIEGSGSGDGDDLLNREKTNEELDYENDRQESSKDGLGQRHHDHEDATSINVPRDQKSTYESPGNNSTSSGCLIIPKIVHSLIILLFIR